MAGITLKEREQVNRELKRVGFAGLDDPNVFAQIATLYKTHESFRGLLMSTAPDQRRIAYESLKSHLCFVPKPLDQYEHEIKEKAEREQWDVYDGTAYPKPFKVGEVESDEYRLERLAQDAIQQTLHEKERGLHVTCTKCTRVEVFRAPTRKQADKDSHAAGWRSDGTRTWCPDHVPTRMTARSQCCECPVTAGIRAWDPQDAYTRARVMGWTWGEIEAHSTRCPKCSAKQITQQ